MAYGSVNGNQIARATSNQVKKIYIGNINYELDTPNLVELFSKFGEVIDAVVIKDKETRASRGFGFVTFAAPESATAAVAEMHGFLIAGRALRVKFAEAKRREANESYAIAEPSYNSSSYQSQPLMTHHEFNE